MDFFQYKNEQLYVEDLPVKQLLSLIHIWTLPTICSV